MTLARCRVREEEGADVRIGIGHAAVEPYQPAQGRLRVEAQPEDRLECLVVRAELAFAPVAERQHVVDRGAPDLGDGVLTARDVDQALSHQTQGGIPSSAVDQLVGQHEGELGLVLDGGQRADREDHQPGGQGERSHGCIVEQGDLGILGGAFDLRRQDPCETIQVARERGRMGEAPDLVQCVAHLLFGG